MQNVISTSDIPFVTVAFKGVVLLDGCFVFLQPKVIILRPWESHSDKDIVLVWSHWSWSLSSFFFHSLAHYRFQWQYWLVRTVSLLVCVCIYLYIWTWLDGCGQPSLAHLISTTKLQDTGPFYLMLHLWKFPTFILGIFLGGCSEMHCLLIAQINHTFHLRFKSQIF